MAKKFAPTIKKLQSAINVKFDAKILINHTQFYSEDADKVLELIVVKKAVWDDKKNKLVNIELFSSTSDVQIVLFLRDYWYELNGWEVPTDNKQWLEAKKKYMERQNVGKQRHRKNKSEKQNTSEK